MKLKCLKKYLKVILFLFLSGQILYLTSCKKDEESEQERKDALTQRFNDQISADTLKSLVLWMENMGTRFALADGHRSVAIKIKQRFNLIGYADTRLDSFRISRTYQGVTYQQWQYNVVATLSGSIYPDSVCIIGAHYDNILTTGNPFTIVPGANDNASGVAAALELARVMKKNNYLPANTIEFIAFGSEELGLYGSYAYAGNAKQKSEKIKLMLNNDMISYQPGTDKSTWIVNILDYDNSHNLRIKAENMCSRFTALNYYNDNTYYRQSDSYPFFTNGFKALFFISGSNDPYYHTLNDRAENFNYDYCREIVKVSCALLVDSN